MEYLIVALIALSSFLAISSAVSILFYTKKNVQIVLSFSVLLGLFSLIVAIFTTLMVINSNQLQIIELLKNSSGAG